MAAIQMAPLIQNPNSSVPTVPPPPSPQFSKKSHVALAMNAIQLHPLLQNPNPNPTVLPPPPPPLAERKRAQRNLFGSPKPGEIDKLLKEEQESKIEKFEKEYNIRNFKEVLEKLDKCNNNTDLVTRVKPYGRQSSIKDYNRVRKSTQRRQETTPPNVPRCITSVAKPQTSTEQA